MAHIPMNLTDEIERRAKVREQNPTPLDQEALELRELIADCGDLSSVTEDAKNDLISIDEASVYLGVTKQTLRNWEKQGRMVPASRTEGGHRRYLRSQVDAARKVQFNSNEMLLHDITPNKIRDILEKLLANFKPDESVNLTIKTDTLDRKVRLSLDSADGFCSVTKTFNMED